MTVIRLLRGELRKLTTTRMPWAFVALLVTIAAIDAATILFATEPDGSKAFIATAADQRSLLAFGVNAMIGTALFGAIAASREYGHSTVVPMFLSQPRRHLAMLAQLLALLLAGAAMGLGAGALILLAGAVTIPMADHTWLLTGSALAQVLAACVGAGAAGGVLGASVGALVRNAGGAVAIVVVLLFVAPGMVPQLITSAADWMPGALVQDLSGVLDGAGTVAAGLGLAAWALVPAAASVLVIQRRDVV